MKKLLFLSLILFAGCHQDNVAIDPVGVEIEYLKESFQYKTIDGIDEKLLSLDVYYNSETEVKKPVVIYVHGGSWITGDKNQNIENKINLFRSLNYILVSINYRLSPSPYEISNPERIKYPMHNIDIADAIKSVYDHIGQYGGDKHKMALLGHSAGAQIVALAGTDKHFLEDVGLSLAVLKGVASFDTAGYDVAYQAVNGANPEMYKNAFGTDVELQLNASPIHNIDNSISYPRFFIAKRGGARRIGYADNFIAVMRNNGINVSEVEASIYDHAGINKAIGNLGETLVTDPLVAFLEACFE